MIGGKIGASTHITESEKRVKRKSTGILARWQDVFILFSKWIKRRIFQIFRHIRQNLGTNIL